MPMAIGLGVLAGPAPPAEAATAGSVSVSSTGLLKFTAGSGAINDLTVSRQTLAGVTAIVLQDDGAPITAGANCQPANSNTVACLESQVHSLKISVGDLHDYVLVSAAITKPATIDGGDGFNDLTGGSGRDTLIGGPWGNDLRGGPGADTLLGGPSSDWFYGGGGPDTFTGGGGEDAAIYDSSPTAVVVSLDGVANDGASGEGDNVQTDVENVFGSPHGDTITGDDDDNMLVGGEGADTLNGAGGDDWLRDASPGADTLNGGPGDDTFDGGPGADTFNGGPDIDTVRYDFASAGVTVSLDGVANDGASGEGDNVQTDVENVFGSPYDDTITGDADDNLLNGLRGADTLNGAGGADSFEWSFGPDTFNGGSGIDTVSYDGTVSGVTVTLDGLANDGRSGEGDNVQTDVENLIGSDLPDVLEGNNQDNHLTGSFGDDTIRGRAGSDTLVGGDGFDTLKGGFGTDSCDVGPDGGTREDCES